MVCGLVFAMNIYKIRLDDLINELKEVYHGKFVRIIPEKNFDLTREHSLEPILRKEEFIPYVSKEVLHKPDYSIDMTQIELIYPNRCSQQSF